MILWPIVTKCQMSHIKTCKCAFFCDDIFDACYSRWHCRWRWHCHCHCALQICVSFQKLFSRPPMMNENTFQNAYLEWIQWLFGHLITSFFDHSFIFVRKTHISRAHQSNNRWWLIVEIQFVDIVFQFPLEIPIWWRSDQMIIIIIINSLIHLFVCLAFFVRFADVISKKNCNKKHKLRQTLTQDDANQK